jgi:hypothetical protein
MVRVTVEARNDADNPGLVKLQGETWELNIRATTDELWKLAGIEKTDWESRQGRPRRPSAPRFSRDHRTLL